MAIVLIEDDEIQAASIVRQIKKAFPEQSVRLLTTEHAFREAFDDLAADPPSIFVIDVMLRWTTPAPKMPDRPEEVRREGTNRAGFRCKTIIEADSRTRHVPVVLYTVLGKDDLRGELDEIRDVYVQKGPEPNDLVEQLQKSLGAEEQRQAGSFALSRNRRRA